MLEGVLMQTGWQSDFPWQSYSDFHGQFHTHPAVGDIMYLGKSMGPCHYGIALCQPGWKDRADKGTINGKSWLSGQILATLSSCDKTVAARGGFPGL